jgi:hypothetical protein
VFIIGVCVVSVLVAIAVEGLLPVVATVLWDVALAGVVAGLPAALGVAILRNRLYDIDRVISRALVYAILTVILGLGYGSLSWPSASCSAPASCWRSWTRRWSRPGSRSGFELSPCSSVNTPQRGTTGPADC